MENKISNLLQGRVLVDQKLNSDKERDIITGLKELKKIGSRSRRTFMEYNKAMVAAQYERCLVLIGECDMCEGRAAKPDCFRYYCEEGVTKNDMVNGKVVIRKDGLGFGLERTFRKFRKEYADIDFMKLKVGDELQHMPNSKCAYKWKVIKPFLFDPRWYPEKPPTNTSAFDVASLRAELGENP